MRGKKLQLNYSITPLDDLSNANTVEVIGQEELGVCADFWGPISSRLTRPNAQGHIELYEEDQNVIQTSEESTRRVWVILGAGIIGDKSNQIKCFGKICSEYLQVEMQTDRIIFFTQNRTMAWRSHRPLELTVAKGTRKHARSKLQEAYYTARLGAALQIMTPDFHGLVGMTQYLLRAVIDWSCSVHKAIPIYHQLRHTYRSNQLLLFWMAELAAPARECDPFGSGVPRGPFPQPCAFPRKKTSLASSANHEHHLCIRRPDVMYAQIREFTTILPPILKLQYSSSNSINTRSFAAFVADLHSSSEFLQV
ncbi:uncharacterized protein EI90DRAFT_3290790 [Cantharellus anzutake]|uniref:uncharacterized protein n=1 Tax=Cantharellus anzutake TaxID=1750568 RepID=UPI001908EE34|nr:uncharacterized protein EI90DRAFT_3290790 [Cantharellus anzutake]KAF8327944.1 hypothetical protein EI90DRAFT_3290790 [Cantharellus anzutake]